ncbi:Heat shock protein 70 (Precursor), related [Planoprotostelium fungivorum]|uniref:Heat shock protein 70 (Precursor), related n=1 Tax=Planoprotostelium fungivorum TaxID=1890364 RepID=A0A2P6N3Y9_9EUKA|nr:Heat shock protein 70 (Precursor), related [Planoprotostelium fungivorum]
MRERSSLSSFHDGLDLTETLTRVELEDLNSDLFDKIPKPVQNVLDGAKKRKVQQLLREFFNGKEPNTGVNPDEAVAYGATVVGKYYFAPSSFHGVFMPVTLLTLGIETAGGVMTPIIHRNTLIPTKKTTKTQSQGLRGREIDDKGQPFPRKIGSHWHPPAPRGVPQIEVSLSQDDGLIHVSAEDKGTKEKKLTIMNEDGRLTKEEVEMHIQQAETTAEEDKLVKERAEAIVARHVQNTLSDDEKVGNKLGVEEGDCPEGDTVVDFSLSRLKNSFPIRFFLKSDDQSFMLITKHCTAIKFGELNLFH